MAKNDTISAFLKKAKPGTVKALRAHIRRQFDVSYAWMMREIADFDFPLQNWLPLQNYFEPAGHVGVWRRTDETRKLDTFFMEVDILRQYRRRQITLFVRNAFFPAYTDVEKAKLAKCRIMVARLGAFFLRAHENPEQLQRKAKAMWCDMGGDAADLRFEVKVDEWRKRFFFHKEERPWSHLDVLERPLGIYSRVNAVLQGNDGQRETPDALALLLKLHGAYTWRVQDILRRFLETKAGQELNALTLPEMVNSRWVSLFTALGKGEFAVLHIPHRGVSRGIGLLQRLEAGETVMVEKGVYQPKRRGARAYQIVGVDTREAWLGAVKPRGRRHEDACDACRR